MPRKLSGKQKELLSLTTRVDAELTQQQRILLGYIIYKYNDKSDSVKENGYTHDSRDTIKKECGIGSDTLKTAIVKLENEGLITCERGIAHKQNTRFALTQKTLDAIASHEASYIASYTENSGSSLLEELLNEMKTMRLTINELIEDKKKLIEEVEKLNEKVNRTLEIEVGIEQSCNSSCNKKNHNTHSTCTVTENNDNKDKLEEDMDKTKKTETTDETTVDCTESSVKDSNKSITSDDVKQRNQYISSTWDKLDKLLNKLITINDRSVYEHVSDDVIDVFRDAELHSDWFTDAQWKKHQVFAKRFISMNNIKNSVFKGTMNCCEDESISIDKENADAEPISMDVQSEPAQMNVHQVAPQPEKHRCGKVNREEAEKYLERILPNYEDYDSFTSAMEKKFNDKYGDWDYGKDKNACNLWNFFQRYASDYYWNLSEQKQKRQEESDAAFDELLREAGIEKAPWEESIDNNKNFTPAEAVEHLRAKGAL